MNLHALKSRHMGLATGLVVLLCYSCMVPGLMAATQSSDEGVAGGHDVPVEVLAMRIKHLSTEELTREADYWLAMLKTTVQQLNEEKVKVWQENKLKEAADAAAGESQGAAAEQAKLSSVRETQLKDEMLGQVAVLREQRVQLIDRMNVVLNELSAKLGLTPEGEEQE